MAWQVVKVMTLGDELEGYAFMDTVTGGIVRPLKDHPQSVFKSEQFIERLEAYLLKEYGDPRKGEHSLTLEDLRNGIPR